MAKITVKEKLQMKQYTLRALDLLNTYANSRLEDYMEIVTDEDGNPVVDSNGEYIRCEPKDKDGWMYNDYMVSLRMKELVEQMIDKEV